jgi:hypothetical protein
MNTPYTTIGHADTESALLTNAEGYDVAVLEKVSVRAPGLPPENHLTPEQWQQTINLVHAAPKLLEAAVAALTYLEAHRPKGNIKDIFSELNAHENSAVKPLRAAIAEATTV